MNVKIPVIKKIYRNEILAKKACVTDIDEDEESGMSTDENQKEKRNLFSALYDYLKTNKEFISDLVIVCLLYGIIKESYFFLNNY